MEELIVEGTGTCASNSKPIVVLRQKSTGRSFRIFVNQSEADAIAGGLQKVNASRPLTHDLIISVIVELGSYLESVKLLGAAHRQVTGRLVLRCGEVVREIDCRPGDAVAMAIRAQAPIFTDEVLLEKNALSPGRESLSEPGPESDSPRIGEEELKKLTIFRDFIDTLDLDDLERT